MKTEESGKGRARYGMVVNLDRCNGCGACVVACAVENNVPPAAPQATDRTGIAWLRVQRVLNASGHAAFLPLMCQQCDAQTPCASVCPQNAVEVDPSSGIVGQVPQRCLGCRYCMVACPYHARYFNWWDPEWPGSLTSTLNPAVSTRTRGVVEKCSFCNQRLQAARTRQAAADAAPTDAAPTAAPEYKPACVEACPAHALVFGNLEDPASAVAQLAQSKDSFRLLESLATGSKVYYHTRRSWVRQASLGAPAREEAKTHA